MTIHTLFFLGLLVSLLASGAPPLPGQPAPKQKVKRNVIIFVADGLRHGSVNETDTPTLYSIRQRGVYFRNSHSLFPTFTTANASAIATGHYLGDTGDFSNGIYTGYPIFSKGNFGRPAGTVTPFLEDDQKLGDLDDRFGGDYLTEATLFSIARKEGYNTAVVGKLGPAAIQDIEELQPSNLDFRVPQAIIVDDSTGKEDPPGHKAGLSLNAETQAAMHAAGLDQTAPDRSNNCRKTDQCNNDFAGNGQTPGTTSPNLRQQQYFTDAVTKVILPAFLQSGKPFLLVFWSRDPDGTQHFQGDSLQSLRPGINGPTSLKGIQNSDRNLKQILDFLDTRPDVEANTDIIVTSDHGFATISRHEVDNEMHFTRSKAARHKYLNADGDPEIPEGHLPAGFLAMDLAQALNLTLYDPDKSTQDAAGHAVFQKVDLTAEPGHRPTNGNGLIGDEVHMADGSDAKVVVAANGGSDLIYIPDHDKSRARTIVDFLSQQDYVGALFADTETYGQLPGALSLRAIGLLGSTPLPEPAIVVSFKVFYLEKGDLQSAIQISDTPLQEGQGMHGGFGRDSTFNNMAAMGPDFKKQFVDPVPVGNADIAVTVAHILGLDLPSKGNLRGRVLIEALQGGPSSVDFAHKRLVSGPASGKRTVLEYQQVGDTRYFDQACFLATLKKRLNCSH